MLVTWDRSLPAPVVLRGNGAQSKFPGKRKIHCLWFAGFIANRLDLISRWNLTGDISDRYLLVYLYRQYGSGAAQHLAGPFAWLLWDEDRQVLLAACDRVGNHGIYYTLTGNTVLLANHVESLLDELPGPGPLNPRSVVGMLNGDAPLPGETFYQNINAVEWGGVLTIGRDKIDTALYWRLQPQPLLRLQSDTAYADALRELLFTVAAQYTPECPMGIMLSSGMDSNSVAAAIKSAVPEADLTAFTFITPEIPGSDESPYTSAVRRHGNIPAVTIRADLHWSLSSAEGIETPKSGPFYNLFAEVWSIAYREINRRKINVLFTGSGGDNLFGGRVIAYPDLLLSGKWLQLIRQFRTQLATSDMSLIKMIRRLILGPITRAYVPGRRKPKSPVPWLAKQHHDLYRDTFGRAEKSWHMLPGRQWRLTRLCPPALHLGTALTNAEGETHGIQFRHPLLDHRLIEFAAGLPTSQAFRPGKSKFILRKAMQGYLPGEILDLRRKITSYALLQRGDRERERNKVWPLLTHMRAAAMGFVDEKEVQAAYKSYLDDPKPGKYIYAAVLEDWLRRNF